MTKKYEDFKPKVPLVEFSPLTAFIGMKEGLEGGETFEVLNEEYDSKTGGLYISLLEKLKWIKNQFGIIDIHLMENRMIQMDLIEQH